MGQTPRTRVSGILHDIVQVATVERGPLDSVERPDAERQRPAYDTLVLWPSPALSQGLHDVGNGVATSHLPVLPYRRPGGQVATKLPEGPGGLHVEGRRGLLDERERDVLI